MTSFWNCFVTRLKSKSASGQPTLSAKKNQNPTKTKASYKCGPARLPGHEESSQNKGKSTSSCHRATKTQTSHKLGPAKLPSFDDESNSKCNKTVKFRTEKSISKNHGHLKRTSTERESWEIQCEPILAIKTQ